MTNLFRPARSVLLPVVLLVVCVTTQSLMARTAKAVFVQRPHDAPDKVYLVAPKTDPVEVSLPGRNFSPDMAIPKGNLVFAILPQPLAEGQAIPSGAPTFRIPEEWTRVYLVFVTDRNNKVFPIKAFAINASNDKFGPGHSRIINLTSALVKGKFGRELVTVRPGGVESIKPPMTTKGSFPVRIDYMMKDDKRSTPLVQTNWQHHPDARQVIFITKTADSRYPRVSTLQDHVSIKKKQG